MKITLTNSVTKEYWIYEVEEKEDSRTFYHFTLSIDEDIPDGTYEYALRDDDDIIVATGLAQVGDYKDNNSKNYKHDGKIRYYQG